MQIIFNLSPGGAERLVTDLSNELALDNELYLCVICTDKDANNSFYKKYISEKVNYINLGRKKGINLITFVSIFKLIWLYKPNVVHGHLHVLLYLLLPSIIYNHKIKFFHTLHNTASKTIGFKWQKKINKYLYKFFIQPITISTDSKNSFEELYGLNNSILIENGRSPVQQSNLFDSVCDEIDSYKLHQEDLVFIHIARFGPSKNQKMLCDVFNKLLRLKYQVILLIIGKGFESGRGMELTHNNQSGIYFLGTRHNIGDYLANSDAFCLSSTWEGLPISLLEALSCGVVPICTPAGGVKNVIKNEKIGILSSDFTSESYYESILRFIDDPKKFDKIYLKNYFRENYSISRCAQKHLLLFAKDDL